MKWISLAIFLLLLTLIGVESYQLGFASGHWIGRFSSKWALILMLYLLASVASLFTLYLGLFRDLNFAKVKDYFRKLKKSMGKWTWIGDILIAIIPSYLIFFSTFGALYTSLASRLLLFGLSVAGLILWQQSGGTDKNNFQHLLRAGLIVGVGLVLAESFSLVSDYPFSLHWSEGNRIWDYSVLFGSDRYHFPAGNDIVTFIDPGRQALWGLPFIFPNVSIWAVRFWSAFLVTFPYALLGWFAFRPIENKFGQWFFLGLWTMIFLNQGPIYTPLIFSAILILALRRRPIWIALPLALLAGHYAGISRFTWRFAPAIWVLVLTLADASKDWGKIRMADWLRAVSLTIVAMWTKGIPVLIGIVEGIINFPSVQAILARTELPIAEALIRGTPTPTTSPPRPIESLEGLRETVTDQALLWYRLLPNDVFSPGILLALMLAVLPLLLLLLQVIKKDIWKNTPWGHFFNVLGLLGFLTVGIIASTKVGGGADLHNLDMFFIMLIFLGSMAWEASSHNKIKQLIGGSVYVRALLVALVLIPAISPALTGQAPEKMDAAAAQFELERVQAHVACASQFGQVLFMDQRQLLTFGHMGNVVLAPEYEKKYVMNQALSNNAEYFQNFENDLANGKYAMIVTERQALRYKLLDEDHLGDSLVEENNAWVKWVTVPLLKYYESISNRRGTGVEIFVPIERDFDC